MNHPAVAVLQQVPGFTVNAACSDAVCGEEFRVYRGGLTVSPGRREVLKLKEWKRTDISSVYQLTGLPQITECKPGAAGR